MEVTTIGVEIYISAQWGDLVQLPGCQRKKYWPRGYVRTIDANATG